MEKDNSQATKKTDETPLAKQDSLLIDETGQPQTERKFISYKDMESFNEKNESEEPLRKTRKKRMLKKNKPVGSQRVVTVNSGRRGRKPNPKKIRLALGFNQMIMAEKLGISQGMMSLIEAGKQPASNKVLEKLYKLSSKLK